jgi:hypothetical protein
MPNVETRKPDVKIALEPLYVGTALAHNRGDEVPADNVEPNGWGEMVANPGTKAAQAAQQQDGGLSVPDGTPPA